MKKFLFSILLCSISFGQTKNNHPAFFPIIPFETQVISFPRIDGDYTVYYTYKIPYRLLVFERYGDSFIANFRITIEISDETGKLVVRDIRDNKISVGDFDATAAPDRFLEDYLKFTVKKENYKVRAIVSDMNSSGDRPLKPIDLNLVEEEQKNVLHPLVADQKKAECNDQQSFLMSNSAGHIPFGLNACDLIIPVADTSVKTIEVTLENNGEEVSTLTLDESYTGKLGIAKCNDRLFITGSEENIPTRNFLIKNINMKLEEGELIITVLNKDKVIDEKINMIVVWSGKPFSLTDPEKAIELLAVMQDDSVVDELLGADEENYPKVLRDYWKKFDPTPETSFNEIMFEYYSRVDYTMKEFNSISNNNGAKSDRGEVYIKFGKPDNIDRNSTLHGEVIEIWTYSIPQRKFTFVDKIGTGNFILTENQ